LPPGHVVEIYGPPGIGKTRTAMAFAIEARLRKYFSENAREREEDVQVFIIGALLSN
jgi:KaiC/GvpD/RAD55 family RecA-like ATPase